MNYSEPKIKLVPLYPCGLPDIEHDSRYSMDQKDKVMKICGFLANTELCTESICGECANYIFDKHKHGIFLGKLIPRHRLQRDEPAD